MILSFGWTSQYLPPNGTKDTTRRIWTPRTIAIWQKAWDTNPEKLHGAVDKCLAYGGKKIGKIQLTDRPYLESLADMPDLDVIREGGMVPTKQDFIDKYFGGDRQQIVTVIRFNFFPNP